MKKILKAQYGLPSTFLWDKETFDKVSKKASTGFNTAMGWVGDKITNAMAEHVARKSSYLGLSSDEYQKNKEKVKLGVEKAMPYISPSSHIAAWTQGSFDPNIGALYLASDPRLQTLGILGDIFTYAKGPKAIKSGINKGADAVKAGSKLLKKAVVAREIKLGIKLNAKNGRIEVTEDYFNSPDKWYRITETPEKYGIMELGKNVTTHDAPLTLGTINGWRSSILNAKVTKGTEGFIKKPPRIELNVRRKNGQAHGNTSQAAKGKLWGGTTSGSRLFPEGIIEGQAPSMINYGIDRTNFVITPWELVPNGGRVGFHTGEMPMSNLGWFLKTNKGTYTYEPIIPEKRITYLPILLLEPSTSLAFFERKPSKLSEAERAGVPKGERNNINNSGNLERTVNDIILENGYSLPKETGMFAQKHSSVGSSYRKTFERLWGKENTDRLTDDLLGKLILIRNHLIDTNIPLKGDFVYVVDGQAKAYRNGLEIGYLNNSYIDNGKALHPEMVKKQGTNNAGVSELLYNGTILAENRPIISGSRLLMPEVTTHIWSKYPTRKLISMKGVHAWPLRTAQERGIKLNYEKNWHTLPEFSKLHQLALDENIRTNLIGLPIYELSEPSYLPMVKNARVFDISLLRDGYINLDFTPGFAYKKGGKMNVLEFLKNGSGIHIKKKNRGKFTSYCGGKVTDACIRKAKASGNPTLVKRATFADNARHFKHRSGGLIVRASDGSNTKNWWSKAADLIGNNKDLLQTGFNAFSGIFNGINNGTKLTNAIDEDIQANVKAKRALNYNEAYKNSLAKLTNPSEIVNLNIAHNEAMSNMNNGIDEYLQNAYLLKNLVLNQLLLLINNSISDLFNFGIGLLGNKNKSTNTTTSTSNFLKGYQPTYNSVDSYVQANVFNTPGTIDVNGNYNTVLGKYDSNWLRVPTGYLYSNFLSK